MLGARIASLRKQAGMSQALLASHLHVSCSAIGMYEQGRRTPNSALLVALAEEFHVSVDYLLTGQRDTGKEVFRSAEQLLEAMQQCPHPQTLLTRDELIILLAAALIGQ